MSLRVCILPTPNSHPPNNGIGRVIHAQFEYLPKLGIELVKDPARAEVLAGHTQQQGMPRIDVLHSHGVYWSGDPDSGRYDSWHHNVNKEMMGVIRRSPFVTVPSNWVAEPFRRDFRISPVVIPHGVDTALWTPSNRIDSYILWNKNRPNDVCDPTPAWELARRGYHVVSTFGPKNVAIPDRMSITGEVPEIEMKDLVRNAHVYLATTKETFGIGTLEALSCGVPVVGFDWGGTRDLITQGVDGILVRPYDYDALVEACNEAHERRAEMSDAAREKAKRYTWERACEMYADVYRRAAAHNVEEKQNTGVAIVVTSYNYGHFLNECLRSLLVQSMKPSEVVVVDDASQDNSHEVANEFSQRFALEGIGFTTIRHHTNIGVASARNDGVAACTAPYVTCLDADDRLNPLYISACRDRFLQDRGIGIVYTGLGLIRPDNRVTENAWTGAFDWEWQATSRVPPATCIPTAAMFRRSAWEKCGGYRQRYAPGEDAEFYTRLLSCGYTAVKVTESPLIEYRNHGLGAHMTRPYIVVDDDKPWMRDRMYPIGAPSERPPLVRSYSDPLIAVYVQVADGEIGLADILSTIDSIVGQTWREWEVMIEKDKLRDFISRRYPFVKHAHSAPLCVRVSAGTVLPSDYLESELRSFIARGENTEWKGDSQMASCCGGKIDAVQLARLQAMKQGNLHALDLPPVPTTAQALAAATLAQPEYVRMEFTGRQVGAQMIQGMPNSGRRYFAGNNDMERYINAHKDDVQMLLGKGVFRLVAINPNASVPVEVKRAESPVTPEPAPGTRGAWDRGFTTVGTSGAGTPVGVVERTGDSEGTRVDATDALPNGAGRLPQEIGVSNGFPDDATVGNDSVHRSSSRVEDRRMAGQSQAVDESVIPPKFRKVQLPPELAEDVVPAPVDAPIIVHVERGNEEDDAGYDRRVRLAIEAERKRRANG